MIQFFIRVCKLRFIQWVVVETNIALNKLHGFLIWSDDLKFYNKDIQLLSAPIVWYR